MLAQARAAIVATLFFTLLLGVAYPLAVTGIGQLAFPAQANGSLIRDAKGQVVGSSLIAQSFTKPEYLHPRPSAAGADGYDASGSSGSNLGPLNEDLAKRVAEGTKAIQGEGAGPVPADAVTTSGSGLDPHISPENARRQAARVAAARGIPVEQVERLIAANTTSAWLGVFGQPTVNVLQTNLALDAAAPAKPAAPAG
ncbi:MAG: potassium-transporting ATPase subunit KdpC [Phenylobacterium sp.]|uniref:potassium-transporting ATPase subunit KdpC n=1 Tax=Phenylobacterium sp. TaxID=1871053 RepID=UPI0012027BEE|nr:potassium-transporting ATPase subunit KdpC [Phenylobacterium sp.]TAJ70193.1 MAG: potassium-transporting ATPase subunit KdpC [Phenylobacterium sp.]